MRYFTYGVGAQLVLELEIAGAVDRIVHDGADIIQLRLIDGKSLMIHLIDSSIPLYEIKHTLNANTAAGHYTLFILWCDMLLPDDGNRVRLRDWQQGIMALYGGCIYAYKIYMEKLYVFPVYFDAYGVEHIVRYGDPLDVGGLRCEAVKVAMHGLSGMWYIASFTGDPEAYHRQRAERAGTPLRGALLEYYLLLDLAPGVDRPAIKAAYRQLARRYHPDVNASQEAHERMQAINQAYAVIMRSLEAHQ
ncbi:MAG: hypothetical protein OHK0046_20390 [Anaerolineae bacterium]